MSNKVKGINLQARMFLAGFFGLIEVSVMESIWVFLLFYIEEGTALAFCGLTLLGFKPDMQKNLLMGLLQGTAAYLATSIVSYLGLPSIIVVFVLLGALITIIKTVTGVRFGIATAAGFLAFLILFMSQILFVSTAHDAFGITQQQITASPMFRIISGYIGDALLFILALVAGITGVSLVKSPEVDAELNLK